MPLRYVLDEHLRGPLWDGIQRHNLSGADPIDATRVGDPHDLPTGIPDPDILLWTEREGRILVSLDKSTMATHLAEHLARGHHTPGVMTLRAGVTIPAVLTFLVIAAYASGAEEWEDLIVFIP